MERNVKYNFILKFIWNRIGIYIIKIYYHRRRCVIVNSLYTELCNYHMKIRINISHITLHQLKLTKQHQPSTSTVARHRRAS